MSMFNNIPCDRYDNKDECFQNAKYVKTFTGRFGVGQWSFIGPPGSEKNGILPRIVQQGAWDNIAEQMLLEFAESGHPNFPCNDTFVQVKAEAPLHNEDPMNDQIIWQQYIQQVESLSPESKVSRFCMEAGFMRVVEVGQYFVISDNFAQWLVANTLYIEMIHLLNQKGGSKEI